MKATGSNGDIWLLEDGIVIRRKGFANVLTQGLQGEKRLPFATITAVQLRPAGAVMAGLIQFTLKGGREFQGGMLEATKDENAVMFTRPQQAAFEKVRDGVLAAILKGAPTMLGASSIADEIAKLADLVDRGFLTREEFETQKTAVLRGRPGIS